MHATIESIVPDFSAIFRGFLATKFDRKICNTNMRLTTYIFEIGIVQPRTATSIFLKGLIYANFERLLWILILNMPF